MSSADMQTVIYMCASVAVLFAVFIVGQLLKRDVDELISSDWVVDFAAGKPYKKEIKK